MDVLRAGTVGELRAALAEARASNRPTCVYVETETADTVPGAPDAQAWWDVPVAETATRRAAAVAAPARRTTGTPRTAAATSDLRSHVVTEKGPPA